MRSVGSTGAVMAESVRLSADPAGDYRLLEHTADMGIEARAATLDALFIAAAHGLREMVFGSNCSAEPRQTLGVTLEGGDLEELLVAWLGEILFIMEQERFCPAAFQIAEIDNRRLQGSVIGEPSREEQSPLREVKAVTYHRISIRRQQDGWRAEVYVDL